MKTRGAVTAFLLMLLGLSLSGAAPAFAQGEDQIRSQLERTTEGLERAREVIEESDSQRARELFLQAVNLQEQAISSFRNGRPVMALRLTRQARELGARALTLAREDGQIRARAQRELEQAMNALQRAREELGGSNRLLDEAEALLARAREQFGEQHFEVALRLATSARRLIRQALGGADQGGVNDRRILRELERTDQLLQRVTPVIRESDDEQAQTLGSRASELQAQAWEAFRSDRSRVALASTREARGLLQRALSLIRGPIDAERIERALETTNEILLRAREVVEASDSQAAAKLLERAESHQAKAKQLLESGKLRNALAETRVAQRLAKRAARIAQGGGKI